MGYSSKNQKLFRASKHCKELKLQLTHTYIKDSSTELQVYLIGNSLGHTRKLLPHDRLVKQSRRLVLLLRLRGTQYHRQIFATWLNRHRLSVRQTYVSSSSSFYYTYIEIERKKERKWRDLPEYLKELRLKRLLGSLLNWTPALPRPNSLTRKQLFFFTISHINCPGTVAIATFYLLPLPVPFFFF